MIDSQTEQDRIDLYDNPGHNSYSHHTHEQHHCCNFHHIVQLQDGSTRSVLCSNLKMAPPHPALRSRNQVINAKPCLPGGTLKSASGDSMGNGGCGAALLNSGHNSSSATASTTESVLNKMYSGPERII